ncbi:MAG TPA: hypothetical protein DCL77_14890 [Prolixibacteraceae bacterium]|jgi:hypothetical protein|nr:hypothetical protein [Prolixibacteraceae bacterium]
MEKIVAQFNIVGFTPEQYSQATKDLEAAGKEKYAGRLCHIAAQQPNGLLITDVWESEDALNRFSETLVPILTKNGVTPAQPTLFPLQNMIIKEVEGSEMRQENFAL